MKVKQVTHGLLPAWRKSCCQNINPFVHTFFHPQASLTKTHLLFLHLPVLYSSHFQTHYTSYKLICTKIKKRQSGTQEEKHPIVDMSIQKQLEEMPKTTEQQLILMRP